jgi:xylose isomerase
VPLEVLAGRVAAGEIDPQPVSGRQELLENLVNGEIWAADRDARVQSGARP